MGNKHSAHMSLLKKKKPKQQRAANLPLTSQAENNSTKSGANPSCPSGVTAVDETREVAKALAQETDSNLIHLLHQNWKADPRNSGGASRARDPANDETNSIASLLHLPPVSRATPPSGTVHWTRAHGILPLSLPERV